MSFILGSFGNSDGTPVAPRCPERTVLVGVDATSSKECVVSIDNLLCQDLNDVISKQMENIITVAVPQNVRVHHDAGGSFQVRHLLAPGLAVTGANIRATHRVDGLELLGRDAAMLSNATVAKPYIGATRGNVTLAEAPPSARSYVVGLNAQQVDDGSTSMVTRLDLVFDNRTTEMYQAMAGPGAVGLRPELRKCIGLDSYSMFESKFGPDVCTQFAAHYCPSTPDRLLECNNSHFCKLNPEFCDSAYRVLCETIDSRNQKFCSCSYVNPQMLSVEGYRPACHNSDCYNKSVAYQTREQAMQHCTNIVVCLQDLLKTNVKKEDLYNVTYTNSCGLNASNLGPTDLAKQMMIDPDKGTADALAVHVAGGTGSSTVATTRPAPVTLPGTQPLAPVPPPSSSDTAATTPALHAPSLPAQPVDDHNAGADIDMAQMMSEDDVNSTTLPPATETPDPPPPSSVALTGSSASLLHLRSAVRKDVNYFVWLVIIVIVCLVIGTAASRLLARR